MPSQWDILHSHSVFTHLMWTQIHKLHLSLATCWLLDLFMFESEGQGKHVLTTSLYLQAHPEALTSISVSSSQVFVFFQWFVFFSGLFFWVFLFVCLFFYGHTCGVWKFLGQRLNQSYSCWPVLEPQQHQIELHLQLTPQLAAMQDP